MTDSERIVHLFKTESDNTVNNIVKITGLSPWKVVKEIEHFLSDKRKAMEKKEME